MTLRLLSIAALALLTTACAREGRMDEGGIYVVRSTCPQAGIPAGTGDITLFDPPSSTDARAIDIEAAITNLRVSCNESGDQVVSTAGFDVVATRRDAGAARQVVLPFFNVVMQGGTRVAAKKIGAVALNFPAGAVRAQTSSRVAVSVHRGAASLPPEVRAELTRKRKVGDADAAVDPMTDPKIRDAVANATFEHLVGFQLTDEQLRYNATR
ncbi:hypothetical protein [Sphingomonas mesophila]|uniref:hypothetical protein n=1 Tax=Sphingomonas mesophila TaxID=2303576 RepID=UPI0019674C2D|nr:hypothetical protein [Sphingomonas mesophila]